MIPNIGMMSLPGQRTIDPVIKYEGNTMGAEQMKISEGLNIISTGWIRKPKGFRVKFNKPTEKGYRVGYSPPLDDVPMTSDVTAWRYAWKLWQATRNEAEANGNNELYNIVVVDDLDHPTQYYATGEPRIFNPRNLGEKIEIKAEKEDGKNGVSYSK